MNTSLQYLQVMNNQQPQPTFLMIDPILEEKERKEQYILMEQIIKEQQKQIQKVSAKGSKDKSKQIKVGMSTKITKKTQIEKALKNFIPAGLRISSEKRPTQDQYREMELINDAEQFSLNYKTFLGKILKVTDGDTVKIAFKLTNTLTRFTFRLNGVDTPESRSGQVKQFGQYVKEVLRRMLEGKIVRVEAGEFDKYGRVLSRIYAYSQNQQFCVNDFLIQNELAKPYQGKTKDQFGKKDYDRFKKKFIRSSWPEVVHYPRIFFKDSSKKEGEE